MFDTSASQKKVSTAMESDFQSVYKGFIAFVEDQLEEMTCNFWYGFVVHDCLAYVGL